MKNRLMVIRADFSGTTVRDMATKQYYFYDGGWKLFRDFGIPSGSVPKELQTELDETVRIYRNNLHLNN